MINDDRSCLETVFEDLLIRLNEISVVRMNREDLSILMLFCNFDLEKYVRDVLRPKSKKEEITYMANCSPLTDLEDKLRDFHKKKKRNAKIGLSGRSMSDDEIFLPDERRAQGSIQDLEVGYHDRMGTMPELKALFDSDLIRQDPVLHGRAEQTIDLLNSMDRAYTNIVAKAEFYLNIRKSKLKPKTIKGLLEELKITRVAVESKLLQDRFTEAKSQMLLSQAKELEDRTVIGQGHTERGIRAQSSAGNISIGADKRNDQYRTGTSNMKLKDPDTISVIQAGQDSTHGNSVANHNTGAYSRSNTTKTGRLSKSHMGNRSDGAFQRASTQLDQKLDLDKSSASIQDIDQSDDDLIIKQQIDAERSRVARSRKHSILLSNQKILGELADDLNKRFNNSTRPRRMSSLRSSLNYNEAEIDELFGGTPKTQGIGNLGRAYLLKQISIREHSRPEGSLDSSIDDILDNKATGHGGHHIGDIRSIQQSRRNSARNLNINELGKSTDDPLDSSNLLIAQPLEDLGINLSREVVLDIIRKKNLKIQRDLNKDMQQKVSNLVIMNEVAKAKLNDMQTNMVDYLKTQKIEIIRKFILDNKFFKIASETLAAERQNKEIERQKRLRAKVNQRRQILTVPKVVDLEHQNADEIDRLAIERDREMMENRKIVAATKESESKEAVFSRVNNRIRFEMGKNANMRSQLEKFLVLWLHNLLGTDESKQLISNESKRSEFFRDRPELFEIALDAMSYRPGVYRFATEFIFEKTVKDDIDFAKVSHNEYQKFSSLREKAKPFMLKTSLGLHSPTKRIPKSQIDVKSITDSYSILNMNFDTTVMQKSINTTSSRINVDIPQRSHDRFKINRQVSRGRMTSRDLSNTGQSITTASIFVSSIQLGNKSSKVTQKSTGRASKITNYAFGSLKSKIMARNIDLPILSKPNENRAQTLENRLIEGKII